MPKSSLNILVVDRDPAVEVVAARLLASACATVRSNVNSRVRVLLRNEEITAIHEPDLPNSVLEITQEVISAKQEDKDFATLIVGFSGLDDARIAQLRNAGVAAPAVNLCQFVLNLDEVFAESSNRDSLDVRDVIVGAALQFGFGGGSSQCAICADKVGDSVDYWINIADTCVRFAQILRNLQK